jgi:hypothetical protein
MTVPEDATFRVGILRQQKELLLNQIKDLKENEAAKDEAIQAHKEGFFST